MKLPLNLFLLLFLAFTNSVYAEDDGSQFTTFAGFKLENAELSDVIQRFGETKAIATGDAGDFEVALCYKTKNGFVQFLSGEMGGGVDLIGFGASENQIYETCTKPSDPQSLLKLPLAGISLGMTKADFAHVVNKSVEWKGNIGFVFFENKRPKTKEELSNIEDDIEIKNVQNYYDVSISIVGTFKGNNLTSFKIWKVETE